MTGKQKKKISRRVAGWLAATREGTKRNDFLQGNELVTKVKWWVGRNIMILFELDLRYRSRAGQRSSINHFEQEQLKLSSSRATKDYWNHITITESRSWSLCKIRHR